MYLGNFFLVDHEGMPQNYESACDYLICAALLGEPDALVTLEWLGNEVPPEMQFKISEMYSSPNLRDELKEEECKEKADQ